MSTSRNTIDSDGVTLALRDGHLTITQRDAATSATILSMVSNAELAPWDTLVRHSALAHEQRKRRKMDGNPYVPKAVRLLGELNQRHFGRRSSSAPLRNTIREPRDEPGRLCRRSAGSNPSSQSRSSASAPRPLVSKAQSNSRTVRRKVSTAESHTVLLPTVVSAAASPQSSLRDAIRGARLKYRQLGSVTSTLPSTPHFIDRPIRERRSSQHFRALEVYFEGEDQPVLVLRDCVHPLHSLAYLREVIDQELQKLPGGNTLARHTGWTFRKYHPKIFQWLKQLQTDFQSFYSDTDHARYTGAQAKEMRLTILRHREQAQSLKKYLRLMRSHLESYASVAQVCPILPLSRRAVQRFGMPNSRFVGIPWQPAPRPIPVPRKELKSGLRPILGPVRAQLERMLVASRTGNKVPPPVDSGLPSFTLDLKRVAYRLEVRKRRQEAIGRYDAEAGRRASEWSADDSKSGVPMLIPRVVIFKESPSLQCTTAEIMVSQIAEICHHLRGGTASDAPPTTTTATLDDTMRVLLGDDAKGLSPVRSSVRSRSPISNCSSPSRSRSRSPIQTSPGPGSSSRSSFAEPHVGIVPAEELERTLSEGVAPLHQRDALGWSLLDHACWNRLPRIVQVLCQHNMSPNYVDTVNGDNILHRYVKSRLRTGSDLLCLKAILDHSNATELCAALRCKNFQGHTPLMLAVELEEFIFVQALFKAARSARCVEIMPKYPSEEERQLLASKFTFDTLVDTCSADHLRWVEENAHEDPVAARPGYLAASLLHRALMAPSFTLLGTDDRGAARANTIVWALDRGVDPLAIDCAGRSAMHCAAATRKSEWVLPLVESCLATSKGRAATATVDTVPSSTPSPSHSGADRLHSAPHSSGTINPATSAARRIARVTDGRGDTILHAILRHTRSDESLNRDGLAYISHTALLPYIDLAQQNADGNTVLHLAMLRRCTALTQQLCKNLKYESVATLEHLFSLRNDDHDTILGSAIRADFADGVTVLLALEGVAEIALRESCSDGRLPLLFAVDIAASLSFAGREPPLLSQRPHCDARGSSDTLALLLRFSKSYNLIDKMIHQRSGPRGEMPLHSAARNSLWHTCALLTSYGASPNKTDVEGRTPLGISLGHATDVSLPRLLLANDTSEWTSGESLMLCIRARGAASVHMGFVREMFLQRYPFPWTSANFSTPLLRAAVETGNILLADELLPLIGFVDPALLWIPEFLLDAFLDMKEQDRGQRWRRRPVFRFPHCELPCTEIGPLVEQFLVKFSTMADEPRLVEHHPQLLFLSIRAGFERFTALLVRLGERCHDSRLVYSAHLPQLEHIFLSQVLPGWNKGLRTTLLRNAIPALLSSPDERIVLRTWSKAIGWWYSTLNTEAMILASFTRPADHGASDSYRSIVEQGVEELRQRIAFVEVSAFRRSAPCSTRRDLLWLCRRCHWPGALILTAALVDDVTTILQHVSAVLRPEELLNLCVSPLRVSHRAAVEAVGRRRLDVLRRAGCREPTALNILLQSEHLSKDQMRIVELVLRAESKGYVIASALRAAAGARAFDTAQWALLCVLSSHDLAGETTSRLLDARNDEAETGSLAAVMLENFDELFFSPSALDMLKRALTAIRHPLRISTLDRWFQSMLLASQRFATHVAGPNVDSARFRTRCDELVLRLVLGCTSSTERPPSIPSEVEPDDVVAYLRNLEVPTSDLCASLQLHHVEYLISLGLEQTLTALHKCLFSGFPALSGVMSSVRLSTSSRAVQMKYLCALIHAPPGSRLDCHTIATAVDMCRAEQREWKQHSWWLEHVLDVFHQSAVRRIPGGTRQKMPVLSFMRDVARTDPVVAREQQHQRSSKDANGDGNAAARVTTPLHEAVRMRRDDLLSTLLVDDIDLDVNALDHMGRGAICVAAKLGAATAVRSLIEADGDILAEDYAGFAACHYAATPEVVNILLDSSDGGDAANSKSSKPHRITPLMHHLRSCRPACALAMLAHRTAESVVLDSMIDSRNGETLLHAAVQCRSMEVLSVLQLRFAASPAVWCRLTALGYSPRDYCRPRSELDEFLAAKGVPRCIRLWPEGKYSLGERDYRVLSPIAPHLLGIDAKEEATVKNVLGFHPRQCEAEGPLAISIDEKAWDFAKRGEDKALLALLELGTHDMQKMRLFGLPVPRSENDKRNLTRDLNQLLQMRFGGSRGGAQLVFPDTTTDASGSKGATDPPYAAVHLIDEEKVPALLGATNLSVKNCTLRPSREPPRGPTYRTKPFPRPTTTLLHAMCRTGCTRSLEFVIRNNSPAGMPNALICKLLTQVVDSSGLSPCDLAFVHRQWNAVAELLKARIPIVRSFHNLFPTQLFASDVQMALLKLRLGSEIPNDPALLCDALRGNVAGVGCAGQVHRRNRERYSGADAFITAYAFAKTSVAGTPAGQLARMQRIVLTAIIDPSAVERALRDALVSDVDAICRSPGVRQRCTARQRELVDGVRRHISTTLALTLDVEGADARDSGAERERMKALYMYHANAGVLVRLFGDVVTRALHAIASPDEAHTTPPWYAWVCCAQLREVVVRCSKKVTDEPTVSVIPVDATGACKVEFTIGIDASGTLLCPNVSAALEDYFCTSAVRAGESLLRLVQLHRTRSRQGSSAFPLLNCAILSDGALLVRNLVESLDSHRFLRSQLPRDSAQSSADVCAARLRTHLGASASTEDPEDVLRQVRKTGGELTRLVSYVHRVLEKDIVPIVLARHDDTLRRTSRAISPSVYLTASRVFTLGKQCSEVSVFFGPSEDDRFLVEATPTANGTAFVREYQGLRQLSRNWIGEPISMRNPVTSAATRTPCGGNSAGKPKPRGLELLWNATIAADRETRVILAYPLERRSRDATSDGVATTDVVWSSDVSHGNLFRSSQYQGLLHEHYLWIAEPPLNEIERHEALTTISEGADDLPKRPQSVLSIREVVAELLPPEPISAALAQRTRGHSRSSSVRVASPLSVDGFRAHVDDLLARLRRVVHGRAAPVSPPLVASGDSKLSRNAKFAETLVHVFPYLCDVIQLCQLRCINRATASVVDRLLVEPEFFAQCAEGALAALAPVQALKDQARTRRRTLPFAAAVGDASASGSTETVQRVPCGIRWLVWDALCAGHFRCITDHRRQRNSVDMFFQLFLREPELMFQHRCSILGFDEGSRLPRHCVPSFKRTDNVVRTVQGKCNREKAQTGRCDPLAIIETTFRALGCAHFLVSQLTQAVVAGERFAGEELCHVRKE